MVCTLLNEIGKRAKEFFILNEVVRLHQGNILKDLQENEAGSPVLGAIAFQAKWKWKWSRLVVTDSLRPHGLEPTRLLPPWDFPGKSTGVGCHFPSPGHLPDPGIEPRGLPHSRWMLQPLSHQGSPFQAKETANTKNLRCVCMRNKANNWSTVLAQTGAGKRVQRM